MAQQDENPRQMWLQSQIFCCCTDVIKVLVVGTQKIHGSDMAHCLDLSHQLPAPPVALAAPDRVVTRPLIWLLLGERHGDNGQLQALAATLLEAFGWGCEIKQLHYDRACLLPHRARGWSLIGLDQAKSASLLAPWPDIVIAAGKSAAPILRWIAKQSGGTVRTVLLGRPRAAYRHFDLIVATPQYGMPRSHNVIRCALPMTRTEGPLKHQEIQEWDKQLQHLPRPWTAVMIGGETAQFSFDEAAARRLLKQLQHLQTRTGGSLLVTTSPRTPSHVCSAIATGLPRSSYFHAWSKNTANPYAAFLALADNFVVTLDSVTMLAEAADRMKPVYFFRLPQRNLVMGRASPRLLRRLRLRHHRRREERAAPDLLDQLMERLVTLGALSPRNDFSSFEADLQRLGVAYPLDGAAQTVRWCRHNLLRQESRRVADRIMALWQSAAAR